jgi:hypothetical protein
MVAGWARDAERHGEYPVLEKGVGRKPVEGAALMSLRGAAWVWQSQGKLGQPRLPSVNAENNLGCACFTPPSGRFFEAGLTDHFGRSSRQALATKKP